MNCPLHFSVYHSPNQPVSRRFFVFHGRQSNKLPLHRFSPSYPRRRHHRRRLLHKFFPDFSTGFRPSSSPLGKSLKLNPEAHGVATQPLDRLRVVIESKLGEFLYSGRKAIEDLQTLVLVDDRTGELVISCSRSTVQYLGTLLISSIIIHFIIRGFKKLVALGFRKKYSAGDVQFVYKRDRSLSGREVLVAKREGTDVRTYKNRNNMLRGIGADDNELLGSLDWVRGKRLSRSSSVTRLPKWWPDINNSCQGLMEHQEENQRIANKLVQAILDNRMSGRDVLENDIIQLRQLCKASNVRVSFSTEHTRDSLYRTSIDYVLNFCESAVNLPGPIHINGEDVVKFIAGLADNIELENTRAATMVSAAVAARTRSRLLQAWALEMQSQHVEAVDELGKICLIHKIFPPEECSPEMEMVGRGLHKVLHVDQRRFLLNTFRGICGENSDRGVAEALGLSLDQVAKDSTNDCT